MTDHIARYRRPRGRGLRSAAAKRRKALLGRPAQTTPTTTTERQNER